MNATYIRIDLVRQLRNVGNIMFVLGLPGAMYLLFGASNSSADTRMLHANVAFYVMTSMAAYGAAVATTGIAATAATESMLGWGRQLSLTRQPGWGYVANKVAVALSLALVAVAIVFGIGALTGAHADTWQIWAQTFGIVIGGSVMFALYGLAIGMLVKSETASSVASGSLVFLAFFGNMFMPLSGTMLQVARFTPMYGYAVLSRWLGTEGWITRDTRDSLTWAVVNYGVWFVLFALLAVVATRRVRQRQ